MINYRSLINNKKNLYIVKRQGLEKVHADIESTIDRISMLKRIQSLFKSAAVMAQDFMTTYLEGTVTSAIKSVFPDRDTKFHVTYTSSRDVQCKIGLTEDGRELSLFDSDGYGVLDVISCTLHAAYVMLDGSAKILLLDEPFRNLSVDRHELAAKMLRDLSHHLGIQVIINTHLLHIQDYADTVIDMELDPKTKSTIILNNTHEANDTKKKSTSDKYGKNRSITHMSKKKLMRRS